MKDSLVPGAGEGLFAKVCLREGQLCSLFNGIRQRHLWGVKGENFVWSDYRLESFNLVLVRILQSCFLLESFNLVSCFNSLTQDFGDIERIYIMSSGLFFNGFYTVIF